MADTTPTSARADIPPAADRVRGDATAERIVTFLREAGAADSRHAGGRSLLDHLIDTAEILTRWDQPPVLRHAALLHSVYGTDGGRRPLIPEARRAEVRHVAGEGAERLAYLFCVTPRRLLLAGAHRWLRDVPRHRLPGSPHPQPDGEPAAERGELDALILLHMANIADQARGPGGGPGAWLVLLARLAELIADSETVSPPRFAAALSGLTEEDESLLRGAYRAGTDGGGSDADAAGRLALAATACPVVGEPCLWLAHLARRRGDPRAAGEWARQGRHRLRALGTAWDKRLTFPEWLELADRIGEAGGTVPSITDPRLLHDAYIHGLRLGGPRGGGRGGAGVGAGGLEPRFGRYLRALADADGRADRILYPDLDSRPWHDADRFALVRYLEAHHEEIRAEILALDPARFHPESERIGRSGDWDVVFLYERGRRHDDVCAACPVTTRGIETGGTVRTLAGLIYVSRMRPGTHIAPHRGPTNLRLRCHLGISVPDGDCALRVGAETRRWTPGQCLVFDDHFEHEAWNHTDEDRIVLIVDLWHPALTPGEVHLLEGIQRYADAAARRLTRYWATNDAAAGRPA